MINFIIIFLFGFAVGWSLSIVMNAIKFNRELLDIINEKKYLEDIKERR